MRTRTVVVVVLLVCAAACRRSVTGDARSAAEETARLATTPEQKRLWADVAARNAAPGLDRLVASRHQRAPAPPRASAIAGQAVQAPAFTIPPEVVNAVRILEAPAGPANFSGRATVTSVVGDRITLEFAGGRLSFLARVNRAQVRAAQGEQVDLVYRTRDDPTDREEILIVRTDAGGGIVSILESGSQPVRVEVPAFRLVVSQRQAEGGAARVQVAVAGESPQELTAGRVARVGRLGISLLAYSPSSGAPGGREGVPYSINLIAWPEP